MAKYLVANGMSKCISCFSCMTACAAFNRHSFSLEKSRIHIRTKGGVTGTLKADVCLGCEEPACSEVCPTGALKNRGSRGVILKSEDCVGCKRCVGACIAHAITFDESQNLPLVCKQCGVCTNICPNGCLNMEEV